MIFDKLNVITPKITKRRLVLACLLLLLLVAMGAALQAWGKKDVKTCPRFAPHAWRMLDGYLAVRTDNDGTMLLAFFPNESQSDLIKEKKVVPERPVYRWVPSVNELLAVTKDEWMRASGDIVLTSKLSFPNASPLGHDFSNYLLKRGTEIIRTIGRSVVKVRGSPSGTSVAVVSTDARPRGGFWPMSGSGISSDVYYHQIFDRNSGDTVGAPLALRNDIVDWAPEVCWSSDSRFVVYMDSGCRWIWIAPVNHEPQ